MSFSGLGILYIVCLPFSKKVFLVITQRYKSSGSKYFIQIDIIEKSSEYVYVILTQKWSKIAQREKVDFLFFTNHPAGSMAVTVGISDMLKVTRNT